jgi:hypothetical protein
VQIPARAAQRVDYSALPRLMPVREVTRRNHFEPDGLVARNRIPAESYARLHSPFVITKDRPGWALIAQGA